MSPQRGGTTGAGLRWLRPFRALLLWGVFPRALPWAGLFWAFGPPAFVSPHVIGFWTRNKSRPVKTGVIYSASSSGAQPPRLRRTELGTWNSELGTLNVHTACRTKNGAAADHLGFVSSSESRVPSSEFQVPSSKFSPPQAPWHSSAACGFGRAFNHARHALMAGPFPSLCVSLIPPLRLRVE